MATTLSGDAYNPRTKGVIKKLLNGMEFTQLGNGSFTGFIVKSTSLKEVEKRLEDRDWIISISA